ncbi:hypothetical protein MHYP_G00025290 [Metynnis hypsauchen]
MGFQQSGGNWKPYTNSPMEKPLQRAPRSLPESWFCYDFTVRHSPKNPAASFTTSRTYKVFGLGDSEK